MHYIWVSEFDMKNYNHSAFTEGEKETLTQQTMMNIQCLLYSIKRNKIKQIADMPESNMSTGRILQLTNKMKN